ncbi:hypothetical protein lerEdw1_001360 [Lerista edwardsae]|nr:hypothetical protein lerEdw1_001360 [Lerista edwardsae]
MAEIEKGGCGDPGIPAYGKRTGNSFLHGDALTFECQAAFELVGERMITCQQNNQWSGNKPSCVFSCFFNFTTPSGIILSPNYPEEYGNNMNCVWLIISEPGSRIHLIFNDFDVEPQFDYLTVKDDGISDLPALGTFSGNDVPSQIASNGHIVRLEFQSDHSTTGRGFNITYTTFGQNECHDPGIPINGRRFGDRFLLGSSVSFHCDDGFVKTQGSETITCVLQDGNVVWSSTVPRCEAPCGGHLTASSGVILPPGWPGYYKDSLNCEWVIEAKQGHSIKITFDKDGPTSSSPLIGEYHGTQAPQFLISTGNYMYLLFTTDNSRSSVGFLIRYESVTLESDSCLDPGIPVNGHRHGNNFNIRSTVTFSCDPGYTLSDDELLVCERNHQWNHALPSCDALCGGYIHGRSGTVLSPGFPDFYPNSLNCTWTIEVSHGKGVQLAFHTFHLESSHDYLLITEDGSFTEPVARLTGSVLPPTIKAGLFGNFTAQLRFISDFSISYEGFNITFSAPCGGQYTGSDGVVLSPNYPHNYTAGQTCQYSITVPKEFGETLPLATSNQIALKFSAKSGASARGFHFVYQAVPRTSDTQCSSVPEPRYGRRIGSEFSAGSVVRFECSPGYLLQGSKAIRCQSVPNALAQWNDTVPSCVAVGLAACPEPVIPSNGFKMGDRYMVNDVLSFQCEPGYTLQGRSHISCMPGTVRRWNYPSPLCIGAHIQFLNFSTEANHDFLEIQNGPYHTSSMIGQFSGTDLPPSLLSTTHETLIHFYSDHSENRQGFKLAYQAYELQNCPDPPPFFNGYIINSDYSVGQSISFECYPGYVLIGHPVLTCHHGINRNWNNPFPKCEAPCGYNVTSQNGTVYSPGFPDEYPNSKDCTWLITVPQGHGIYINFTLLQTELVNDYIAVWDGPDQNSPQLGVFSGNTALETAYSSSNQVLLKFHSDFSTGGFFVLNFHAYQLKKCQPPPAVPEAEMLTEDDDFEIGDFAKYKCHPGYTLVGNDVMFCKLRAQLQFEGSPPFCEAQCPANEVRTDSSGVILSPGYPGNYPNSQTCAWTLKVEPSYNISIFVETFQSEKQFDELEIFDAVSCGIPDPPGNGSVWGNEFILGSRVIYECNEGFKLERSQQATAVCQEDGLWSNKGRPPVCKPVTCPSIETLLSEHVVWRLISGSVNEFGAQVMLSCSPGYYLVGQRLMLCKSNGTWSDADERPTCKAGHCGSPDPIVNGHISGDGFSYRDTVVYQCNPGFRLVGTSVRICLQDHKWSGQTPVCVSITCGHPGNPAHGLTNGSEFNLNDVVNFTCSTGYLLQGASRAQCRSNGQWSSSLPICRVVNCSDPGFVENAVRHGQQNFPESFKYGISVMYHCKKGFYLLGSAALTCKANGLWDRSLPKCLRNNPGYCDDPGVPSHGTRLGDEFKIKSLLRFSCEMGYQLRGSSERTCLLNGSWSGLQPVCEVISCGDPGELVNGIQFGHDFTFNKTITYQCNPGYLMEPVGASTICCTKDGTWNQSKPICKDPAHNSCPDPGTPHYGIQNSSKGYEVGSRVFFRCRKGYHIQGSTTRMCLANLTWSGMQPECIPHACRQPETPANVDVKAIDLPTLGYTLVYTCQPGFFLAGGSEHRTCKPDMKWTGKSPLCKSKGVREVNETITKTPVPSDVFFINSLWKGFYEHLGKRQPATLTVDWFNATSGKVNATFLEGSDAQLKLSGVYKKEEAHLLLKVYQIKKPKEGFASKLENEKWALNGYVSSGLERGVFTYQGDIHGKDFGKFLLQRQSPLSVDTDHSNHYYGTNSSSVAAAILVPFFALILSGFAFYLYKHRTRPKVQYNGYAGHENSNGQASFENPMYDTNLKPTEAKAVRFDTTLNTVCTVV